MPNINKQSVLKKLDSLRAKQSNSYVVTGIELSRKAVEEEPAVTQSANREEVIKAAKLLKRYCKRRTNCNQCPVNCQGHTPNGWEVINE